MTLSVQSPSARPFLMPDSVPRGRFYAFEGIDGCGKGSMVQVVAEALREYDIPFILMKHPGGTPFGMELRKVMFETIGTRNIAPDALEALFLADHIQNCVVVDAALKAGTWVIADRWWGTCNQAYSQTRKARPEVSAFYYEHFMGPLPDKLFLMYGDPAALLKRAQDRMTETHQAAKKWNTVEAMTEIQKRYMDLFAHQRSTTLVPAEDEMKVWLRFLLYVAPDLLFGVDNFPYRATRLRERLRSIHGTESPFV